MAMPIEGMQRGMGLYHAFNGFEPSQVVKVHFRRMIPPVVVELGELVGLIYRSDKETARTSAYVHSPDGKSTAPGQQHRRDATLYCRRQLPGHSARDRRLERR